MQWMLMPLRRYADFSGRSRRLEYWLFVLFQLLLYVGLFVIFFVAIDASYARDPNNNAMAGFAGILLLFAACAVVWLVMLIPSLAVTVRRLHDTNRSGWWFGGYFLANFAMNGFAGVAMSGLAAGSRTPEQVLAAMGAIYGLAGLGLMVYAIVLFIFFCMDGTPGPNRYGPDPKGRTTAGDIFA